MVVPLLICKVEPSASEELSFILTVVSFKLEEPPKKLFSSATVEPDVVVVPILIVPPVLLKSPLKPDWSPEISRLVAP